jgi:hypothetical protein
MLNVVRLSVSSGVYGCGCPMSFNMFLTFTPSFALMNVPATSASITLEWAFLLTVEMARMGPLWMCLLLFCFELRKKYPPNRLCAFGYDRYEASEWIWRTMSLAVYWMVAYGWVAQKLRSWVILLVVASVDFACSDARELMARMMLLLTARAQYNRVPNTCYVLVISFFSTGGELSDCAVSCILTPYVGSLYGYGECWGRVGSGCWNICRACSMYTGMESLTVRFR